jgi:hypothetical protein
MLMVFAVGFVGLFQFALCMSITKQNGLVNFDVLVNENTFTF